MRYTGKLLMIPKDFDQIDSADIQALLDDSVNESKTLEYKRDLPDQTEKARHGFLAAVASFANTDGGDLIYGVEARDGVPLSITGIGEEPVDKIMLKLESMVRSSIEPRLPKLGLKVVSTPTGDTLIARIEKSWTAPHRVSARESGPFYARHSTGKFEMDVAELRTAFALSETTSQRIENFHNDRVGRIFNHHTPVEIHTGYKIALHIIPLFAFASRSQIDMRVYMEQMRKFYPLGREQVQHTRINLDGMLNYTYAGDSGRSAAYTQIFRSGIVEAVLSDDDGRKDIDSYIYEHHVWRAIGRYLDLLSQMEIVPPFYIFLSLIGVSGYKFRVPNRVIGYEVSTSDQHIISLPEIVVTDPTTPPHKLMRPAFDMVWNAFGYGESQNYDAQGAWIIRNV